MPSTCTKFKLIEHLSYGTFLLTKISRSTVSDKLHILYSTIHKTDTQTHTHTQIHTHIRTHTQHKHTHTHNINTHTHTQQNTHTNTLTVHMTHISKLITINKYLQFCG